MSYLKNKRDGNHREAVQYLTKHGVEVIEFQRPLDLLCLRNGYTSWVELKTGELDNHYTRTQLEFIAHTQHNVIFAEDPQQILVDLREKQRLSQMQKNGIAAMLALTTKKLFTRNDVARAIGKK